MIAVLKYTDCLSDGKNVFKIIANRNIEVLKTKQKSFSICPYITIRINDQNELNQLLSDLNKNCIYEVRLVKVKNERKLNLMYFINFIVLNVCAVAAIWQGFNGHLGWCLIEIALALLNLPFSIKWIKELFEN